MTIIQCTYKCIYHAWITFFIKICKWHMVQSQHFGSFRLYTYLFPEMKKLGINLVTAFTQPETQRRSCFAWRISTEAKLARNHHPASNYSHPFANTPQLPILDFFSLNNSLKARSIFARAQKNGKSPRPQREGATQLLPLPRRADENPEGCWRLGGRCSTAFQNSTRPGLCSWAAPVRFSNSRIAAKSLPMPEEFPEQHSPSFSNCFETTLSVLQ